MYGPPTDTPRPTTDSKDNSESTSPRHQSHVYHVIARRFARRQHCFVGFWSLAGSTVRKAVERRGVCRLNLPTSASAASSRPATANHLTLNLLAWIARRVPWGACWLNKSNGVERVSSDSVNQTTESARCRMCMQRTEAGRGEAPGWWGPGRLLTSHIRYRVQPNWPPAVDKGVWFHAIKIILWFQIYWRHAVLIHNIYNNWKKLKAN